MLCVASDSVATRLGEPERAHTRAALTEFHPELLRAEELRLLENRREDRTPVRAARRSIARSSDGAVCQFTSPSIPWKAFSRKRDVISMGYSPVRHHTALVTDRSVSS
jgi:hypothetical protein